MEEEKKELNESSDELSVTINSNDINDDNTKHGY